MCCASPARPHLNGVWRHSCFCAWWRVCSQLSIGCASHRRNLPRLLRAIESTIQPKELRLLSRLECLEFGDGISERSSKPDIGWEMRRLGNARETDGGCQRVRQNRNPRLAAV